MRLNRVGVVASVIYAVLGLAWALSTGVPWPFAAWFSIVAVGGAFVPGEANQVSLARAYLAAPALDYAARGTFGPLAVVVAVAGVTDLVDGTVARRFKSPTTFGGGLDPVVDGVFMAALGFGLAVGGVFPVWLAGLVALRYFGPALAGGVLLAAGRRLELRHTLTGQVSTVLNLVLLGGVALLRGLDQDPGNLVIGAEIVLPVATLATFAHLAYALRRRPAARAGAA
jgi:phosphatidylglycerophosphate synthase